jgi:hypothetical protein
MQENDARSLAQQILALFSGQCGSKVEAMKSIFTAIRDCSEPQPLKELEQKVKDEFGAWDKTLADYLANRTRASSVRPIS